MYPGNTTVALVSGILDSVDPSVDMTQFIDMANEIVVEKLASQNTPTVTVFTAHRLELIERLLAAHFYCLFDPRTVQEGVSGAAYEMYESKIAVGLKLTRYGQQAMRMDTTGTLAVMDNGDEKFAKVPPAIAAGLNIGVTHLGTPPLYRRPWTWSSSG